MQKENNTSYYIHPLADVKTSTIGEHSKIWQFAIILAGAEVGKNCNINCHTFIENDVVVGNNVTIKSGVYLWDGIRIEDNVFIGPNVTFVNNPYPRSQQYPDKHIGATIKNGASIGANATIMGNIIINEFAMIGAGSVVTKNIPPYELWYGNPAKHCGYVTETGVVLDLSMKDRNTGQVYQFESGVLKLK